MGHVAWTRVPAGERGREAETREGITIPCISRATSTYSPFVEHVTAGETSKGAENKVATSAPATRDCVLYNSRVAVV